MPKTETAVLDLTSFVQELPAAPAAPAVPADPSGHAARFSAMSSALVGSEILRIASELRALKAGGRQVCDLTVGDFNPRYFPIPAALSAAVRAALERGETNYPPANGMPELRQAVGRFYARELGLGYPQD